MTAPTQRVASLLLPLSVKALAAMNDVLAREYGKGLTIRQVGEMLVIERPAVKTGGSAEAQPA
jgi:hypothetical protein